MASTLKVQNIAHTGGTTGLTIASDGTLLAAQDKIVHWKIVPNSSDNHASGPSSCSCVDSSGVFCYYKCSSDACQ